MSRPARWLLLAALAGGLAVIYFPLLLVLLNSFNADTTFGWPPSGLTLDWWARAAGNAGVRAALWTSVRAGLAATAIALVLGTMAAFALARYGSSAGRGVLLLVLPIALPGIVTGIALNNAFRTVLGVGLGLFTAIVAHATFCIVVVFNNVLARLRRLGTDLREASEDLGLPGGRRSGWSPSPCSARRCWPAAYWPSPCPSTKSS